MKFDCYGSRLPIWLILVYELMFFVHDCLVTHPAFYVQNKTITSKCCK